MKERILIGVPTMKGVAALRLLSFLLTASNNKERRFEFAWTKAYAPIEYARNTLCDYFLKASKCDRLWMIDDDITPEATTLSILDVDADIVAPEMRILFPAVPPRGPELHVCAVANGGWLDEANGAVEVAATGTGCTVIKRRVLEDPRMRLDPCYWDPIEGKDKRLESGDIPAFFRVVAKPNGERLMGEDIDFCHRARACGYTVAVHFDHTVGHMQTVDLNDVSRLIAAARA